MPKQEPKLVVEIPRPGEDQPVWSRVGIIALVGFAVGIAWPRLAGVKIGPSVPSDLAAKMEGAASANATAPRPSASAAASPPSSAAAPSASGSAAEGAPPPSNREMVVVGAGKITKCSDSKKDKSKIEDCGSLQFDPIAVKRLKELAKCPSALGLEGKMNIGFEVNFEKKEVNVTRVKKGTSLPSSTVSGIVQCAAREFGNVSLEDVPHKHRRYTLVYGITFYPPGKHPAEAGGSGDGGDGDAAAGATTNQTDAQGSAVVSWDTALVRKDPKDGDVVARIVRGTKVKIAGKQNDWYKIETGGKTGWVYRGAIGM